jgi:hypothetical protein
LTDIARQAAVAAESNAAATRQLTAAIDNLQRRM